MEFDSGLATSLGPGQAPQVPDWAPQNVAPTIKQHYYPEGGWGWLVTFASLACHMLAHGLQLAAAGLLMPVAATHFPTASLVTAGNKPLRNISLLFINS